MNGKHTYKVVLNKEQKEYVYKKAKEAGNISCSKVISDAVYKAVPKKPIWCKVENKSMSLCRHCGNWFGLDLPSYCPCCGHAVNKISIKEE